MKKILVVEDNQEVRENIIEILELANYEVVFAGNGKEGIEQAIYNKPDLIVCDIMMPVLDGYGMLLLIQKHPELQNIPFIFLTAKSEKFDIRKGMSLGADDYIAKPFDPSDLLNSIEMRLKKAGAINQPVSAGIKGVEEIDRITSVEDVLKNFVNGRHVDKFRKKERIYSEGNHSVRVFYLQKGKVRIFKRNEDGKEFIVKIVEEGEFFGYTAMFEGTTYKENANALEDCEIAAIPRQEFEDLVNTRPEIRRKFIRLLANEVTEREEQLIHLAYNSLRRKVADALLNVYKKFGERDGFSISLTREDLAAVAGTATESLIRTLSDFRAEKIIDISSGKIAILNKERLKKMLN